MEGVGPVLAQGEGGGEITERLLEMVRPLSLGQTHHLQDQGAPGNVLS